MVFAQICSYLENVSRHFRNFHLPERSLVAATNRCKVLKILISKKVTAYIQGRKLRSGKT